MGPKQPGPTAFSKSAQLFVPRSLTSLKKSFSLVTPLNASRQRRCISTQHFWLQVARTKELWQSISRRFATHLLNEQNLGRVETGASCCVVGRSPWVGGNDVGDDVKDDVGDVVVANNNGDDVALWVERL